VATISHINILGLWFLNAQSVILDVLTELSKILMGIHMATNSNWNDIRTILSRFSARDLLGIIGELYSLSNDNKRFLDARFLRNNERVIQEYKDQIKKYIAPSEPWRNHDSVKISKAEKLLSDFKEAISDEYKALDLMIYYIECGTQFSCDFGDLWEEYYDSLESVFNNVIKSLQKYDNNAVHNFIERLRTIVKKSEWMGYGYYDNIYITFEEQYNSV
jgi:Na+/phosphate symporter